MLSCKLVMHEKLQKQPPRGVLRKGVQKIRSKFIGEHPCLKPATLLKKRL